MPIDTPYEMCTRLSDLVQASLMLNVFVYEMMHEDPRAINTAHAGIGNMRFGSRRCTREQIKGPLRQVLTCACLCSRES